MTKDYEEIPFTYSKEKSMSSEDEFVCDNWSVRRDGSRYYFSYISGELAGKLKEIEIEEEDFKLAKEGNLTFDNICIKYNVS